MNFLTEPSKHINLLFAKWESAIGEKERLVKQISEMEVRFKEDLHEQLESQKTDAEGRISDAVEAAKLEGILNSFNSKKQATKFLSANFQKILSPNFNILSIQRLEGKQCRSC